MSINGVLEDLPLADVLQFIHLGRRTGTLYMWRDDENRAEIGFHDGSIVSAWTPGQQKLGDLLVEASLISVETLYDALRTQSASADSPTLGQILLEEAVVTREQVHQVIREQVKKTIFELVTWQQGNFHFEVDELHPVDEFALVPGEVLNDLDLNTQMVLLEAARIFDERHLHKPAVEDAAENAAEGAAKNDLDRHLQRAGFGRPRPDVTTPAATLAPPPLAQEKTQDAQASPEVMRCQVVSEDSALLAELRHQLPTNLVRVLNVRLREAGNKMPGQSMSPLVLLDLREPDLSLEDVSTLARIRPSAPLVVVSDEPEHDAAARAAGALAVLRSDDQSLADCFRNLVRVFHHPQPQGTFGYSAQGGYRRFRRVVFDVQSGLMSATMALNLMHVISESVERAVLFLVQDDQLTACGAFGFSRNGEPLAELTQRIKLEIGERGVLRRAITQAKPQSVDFESARLPSHFSRMVGRPASGQVVIFPVLGAERTISLIYTDNGALEQDIEDIRILELATSQVGVAFENELLRRSLGKNFGVGAD